MGIRRATSTATLPDRPGGQTSLAALAMALLLPAAAAAQSNPATSPAPVTAADQASPAVPAAAAQAATTGAAGQDPGTLQDIVVTAQRRSENLQKVPISVSTVDPAQLKAAGVTSSFDLPAVATGVSVKDQSATFAPFIRGVGTGSFGPAIENPVALYVDNVYYASQFAAPRDLNDVSQIAVLKGPQGTLFGRNATGGVIQMTTRDPQFDFGGEVRSDLDEYRTTRNFAYVTGPISDQLAVGISGHYTTQGEGWGKNLATGTDTFKIDHDYGVRAKFLFKFGPNTTIKINGDYSNYLDSLGPWLRTVPDTPAGYVPLFGAPYLGNNRYNANDFRDSYNDGWNGGVSGTIEQNLGFARLVSISAYRRYNDFTTFAGSLGPRPEFGVSFDAGGRQFTQEVQLLSKDSGPFRWVIGGFYFWGREGLPGIGEQFNFYNEASAAAMGLSLLQVTGFERTQSIAGFAEATLRLGSSTRVTGGFRYTHDDRSIENSGQFGFVTVPFAGLVPIGALGPIDNETQKVGRPTWRVSVDHDLTPDILAYASWNRGFKSGGFNVFSPDNPYQPEKLDAYEAGLKTQLLDRRVRFNPSFFYYDYDNIQLTRIQTTPQIINAPKARFYGVDADLQAAVGNHLSFNGGFEWLDAKIVSFPTARSSVLLPFGGIVSVPYDASGNRIPFAAKFSVTASATYSFTVAGADLALTVAEAHNSGYFEEPDNVLRQRPYDLVNAQLRWTSPDKRLEATVYIRNILDDAVLSEASSPEPYGYSGDFGGAPPRTVGASIRVLFGKK